MSKKEESLETRLTRRVKVLYLNKGHVLGYRFPDNPFKELNPAWFREAFASAAHEPTFGLRYYQGKLPVDLTEEELERRKQYVRYFRIVRKRIQGALKRLARNAATTRPVRQQDIIHEVNVLPVPAQAQLSFPGFPPPRQKLPWKVKRRLAAVRKKLVSLPQTHR